MKNGKGSKPRPYTDYNKYSSNWDDINFGMKENVLAEKTKSKKLTDLTKEDYFKK